MSGDGKVDSGWVGVIVTLSLAAIGAIVATVRMIWGSHIRKLKSELREERRVELDKKADQGDLKELMHIVRESQEDTRNAIADLSRTCGKLEGAIEELSKQLHK